MSPDLPTQVYTWSAYLSAAATIATFVTGILFFYVSPAFSKWNDVSSVFQTLFMVPLGAMFYQLAPEGMRGAALLAVVIGVAGMLTTALGQSLLVFGRIDLERRRAFPPPGQRSGRG